MKNLIFILFFIHVITSSVFSQNYYAATKVIVGEGFKYKCDLDETKSSITLYNINNKYTYTEWARKDGKLISGNVYSGIESTIIISPFQDENLRKITAEQFNEAEKAKLKGSKLLITLIINSSTGIVDEVNFMFRVRAPLVSIPVSTYRKVELALKQVFKYPIPLTPAGRELNYCLTAWNQEF